MGHLSSQQELESKLIRLAERQNKLIFDQRYAVIDGNLTLSQELQQDIVTLQNQIDKITNKLTKFK